ncbi:MAG: cytochrome c [Acidovorax sp.]|uniref:c-type cytochrome n=1 Tax=Acidovorax sp. TaxID=1872122 RepID=UPI0039E6EE69
MSPEALNALLQGLQAAQDGLRGLLHALGLAGDVAGQPAWPFAQRIAAEMLLIDAGHARRVCITLACAAAALLAALLAVALRRARWPLWGVSALLLALAPWPQAHLLFTPAVPTSLHRSPTGFAASGIVQGRAVFQAHCARCHGADARGEGPDAAALPVWPPTLTGGLLWKRLDGELFWRIRHGMHARDGRATMPGVAEADVSDAQIWQVLDYLQAHAAGQMLRGAGVWERPVRLPDTPITCRHGPRDARTLAGQRLRVVLAGAGAPPPDDPRFTTLWVGPLPAGVDAECHAPQADAVQALALVLGAGPQQAAGTLVLADRAGWLRARALPGQAAWSEDDLVCRAAPAAKPAAAPAAGDGLDVLIRRMDAEPVRLARGGFPHG